MSDLTIRNFVAYILEKYPRARDDYDYLTAISFLLQKRKHEKVGINLEKTEDFLTAISKGTFFKIGSIEREKRFQQEHFEHLRTPTWYANQDREVQYVDEAREKKSIERWKTYLQGAISIKDIVEFTKTHQEFLKKERSLREVA